MVEYIYFVKCMDCEDEPFDFFDEAKAFALGKLSTKPEIHQTEVVRNDFGECVDSTDYGKIWSWEDEAGIVEDDAKLSIFTSGDFDKYKPEYDSEFDSLDNSLDEVPDNFRMPVPDGMTIDGLVEAMEENEEMIECKRCHELFPKEDMLYELSRGYLCPICIIDLDAAGEDLEFKPRELPKKIDYDSDLTEAIGLKDYRPGETVELFYDELTVSITTKEYPATYWEPAEYEESEVSGKFVYEAKASDVAVVLWENCLTEEDVANVPGGFDALYEDDNLWFKYLDDHFDTLVEKYYQKLLDYYEDSAIKEATKSFQDKYDNREPDSDAAWDNGDYWESTEISVDDKTSLIETLEDSEDYKKRLSMCPECGEASLDLETGICINCGFVTFD